MKLTPIFTEKSNKLAKEGKYTFRIPVSLNKNKVRKFVEDAFRVHVTKVRIIKEQGEIKRTLAGRIKTIRPSKKVIVELRDKEKIDLFKEAK